MTNRILILTNSLVDADILKEALSDAGDGPFVVETLNSLAAGIDRLAHGGIDAVLVDLTLTDSTGLDTFDRLFAVACHTPVLTLITIDEEAMGREAVQRGAQGYLLKGHFERFLLPQALRNIIQRKCVEESLYKERARAEIALNSISDAVICTDMAGNIDYLNIAAETLTGWSKEEADGRPVSEVFRIINGVTREPDLHTVDQVLQANKASRLPTDTILIKRDGSEAAIEDSASPIHDWDGKLTGVVIVFHDITKAQALGIKMAHLAQHDFLTDLPNRILLNDRLVQAITLAKRNGAQLALLFLDLDNFKHINDSLGHATGDRLLQSVAQRLIHCVRASDTVSRQGGDEFVILLTGGNSKGDVEAVAQKILAELALPHIIAKSQLYITTSIGISIYPDNGRDTETLIKSADTAMYFAKDSGRNNFQFFRSDMNTRAVERQFIEANLRRAMERKEFFLQYQPKINLTTGAITGAEALLRWQHPEWGVVLPDRFVQVAEDCGVIVPIGRWVLREACSEAMRWRDFGQDAASIAVNISALEFRQPDFLEGVRAILRDTGLDASRLQLEITESVLMGDVEISGGILRELKKMGVQLAIDDFGTGYSSLSYLNQFPLDVLKIDQSFVHGIVSSDDDGVIVSAVIAMGNSLKLKVVAEGVENAAQLNFLKARHCEEGQGNLFSCSIGATQFKALLETGIDAALVN
jgi:diguanylate cyclase (GGDEF)-like protein/PAS domain S-box-containing protein